MSDQHHFPEAAERTFWMAEDAERFPDDDEISEAHDEEDDEEDDDELDEDEREEDDLDEE